MNYTISGNPEGGYTIKIEPTAVISLCPCCGKPIDTLRKAYMIAENLSFLGKDAS